MTMTNSRFCMWRAVTAMVHADAIVRPHEVHFIVENIRKLPFTDEQVDILSEDLRTPRDMELSFREITAPRDKEDFFHLARAIAWSDGELDAREAALLEKIRNIPLSAQDKILRDKVLQNHADVMMEANQSVHEKCVFAMLRALLNMKIVPSGA